MAMWRQKEAAGEYLRRMTRLYLIWDPEKHHRVLATSGRSAKRDQYGMGFEHRPAGRSSSARSNSMLIWSASSKAC